MSNSPSRREEKFCLKSWSLLVSSPGQKRTERALNLLAKYHDIFALEDGEMGCTEAAEHKIEVTDPKPFKERPRNIPSGLLEEVKDHLRHMLDMGEPTMYTTIKGFIGLVGHYRCLIKDFAKIADPLHEYVRGDTAKKKKEYVVLNEAARDALCKVKKAVMSAPVLAYPDPYKEYLLKTDASKLGLGAVLSQKQSDRRYHPVAFRSRVLHGVEVNYHSTKT